MHRPLYRLASPGGAIVLTAALVLLSPLAGYAQDGRAALENVAKAMGAASVKSIQYSGSGVNFQVGQNFSPDTPWPRFIVKSYTRAVNYENASIRDELVRTQGENPPRGGGGQPVAGEQRQIFVASGDFAWNVMGEATNPTPVALVDRQTRPSRVGRSRSPLPGASRYRRRSIPRTWWRRSSPWPRTPCSAT